MKLSQKTIGTIGDGVFCDDATRGLYLVVTARGKRSNWVFRRKVAGKRYDVGLGGAKNVSLAKARSLAASYSAMSGDDFVATIEKARAEKGTHLFAEKGTYHFQKVCEEFMAWNIQVGNWEERDKAWRVFESRMRCHVWPKIGAVPIDEIEPATIAEIISDIWDKPDIVNRCLQLCKKVFDWAKAKGYTARDNPADRKGALQFLLPNSKHIKQNRGALSVADLPIFFAACMTEPQSVSRQCFEFAVLTATRSLTARKARWDQIDFENRIWTIPPEQLKVSGNGALIVPLADRVVDFLKRIDRPHEGLIFPSSRTGTIMSDAIVSRTVRTTPGDWIDHAETLKRGETVRPTLHGIARATFMTWSQDDTLGNDKRFDVRVAHMALHHKQQDGYNGAYERQTMFLRRRELMSAWAEYCFSAVK